MLRASLALLLARAAASPPPALPVDVYRAGSEGVPQYRIPALVQTPRGTLLAFAEARTAPASDCGYKWLVVRRSSDGGATWSASTPVAGAGARAFSTGNPQAVFHAPSGRVVLVYGAKDIQGDPHASCSPGSGVFAVDDGGSDGAAWGAPRNISGDLGAAWGGLVPGPGAGAVTAVRNPGRILMSGSVGAYTRDVVFYSDDAGASWRASATPLPLMDESAPVELPSGDVYVTMRNGHATACDCQAYATSENGGATFSAVAYDATLVSPACQAALLLTPGPAGALYFSNPASRVARENLTVRRAAAPSLPLAWQPASHLVAGGLTWGGYSSMAGPLARAPGLGGILFERNDTAGGEVISFATFPLDF